MNAFLKLTYPLGQLLWYPIEDSMAVKHKLSFLPTTVSDIFVKGLQVFLENPAIRVEKRFQNKISTLFALRIYRQLTYPWIRQDKMGHSKD